MKISNFKMIATKGKSILNREFIAEVDVTTKCGFLFSKTTTERRKIRREYASFWHFVDTGEWTPDGKVEALVRKWEAEHGKLS